jgi:hypothetical protein
VGLGQRSGVVAFQEVERLLDRWIRQHRRKLVAHSGGGDRRLGTQHRPGTGHARSQQPTGRFRLIHS